MRAPKPKKKSTFVAAASRFMSAAGAKWTKAKSLLYGVDFNILVLPIAQPVPEAKVVLHELENIYHVMFDDELYKRVCHPFIAE